MLQRLKGSNQFKQARSKARKVAARLADKHIKLAVTGLSGSGKTAFITSLVNQLLYSRNNQDLPFFSVQTESRLLGVKRGEQPDLQLSRFAYDAGIQSLSVEQWPASTKGMSQVRLQLKFQRTAGVAKFLAEDATLLLDITDYPGEWLLDLPLLNITYQQWSEQCFEQLKCEKRKKLAQEFSLALSHVDLLAASDESKLQQLAEVYSAFLQDAKAQGYEVLQPGRFVLPGELMGAPILHFVPLLLDEHQQIDWDNVPPGSNLQMMQQRFELYKKQVVLPFYQHHFKHFDRQIVLVDCLGALNQGAHRMGDLQQAIESILSNFSYGKNNFLKRLFRPAVDRLLFAATKADRVTADQQQNLGLLLASLVERARREIEYEGIEIESMCFAAIRASKEGKAVYQGQELPVLSGKSKTGEMLTLYPGDVPARIGGNEFWSKYRFTYPDFLPPNNDASSALPHVRMDSVIEFLIGDKLR